MSGLRKRFDPALYAANDELCRNKIKELLPNLDIRDNPKKRDVDLLIYDKNGNHVANIEVERKLVWKGSDFKYDSIQFAQRKQKYASLPQKTYFVMFNEDFTNYLIVEDATLLASPCVEVPNKYMYKGEYFFQVPKSKVKFNNLQDILDIIK